MVKTTRAQRESLLRLYIDLSPELRCPRRTLAPPLSYKAFRKSAAYNGQNIIVPYAGIMIGIEKDGCIREAQPAKGD